MRLNSSVAVGLMAAASSHSAGQMPSRPAALVGRIRTAGSARPADPLAAAATPGGGGTLADKLNERMDADFIETPLKDAISFLVNALQFIISQAVGRAESTWTPSR
jgi:hypothetical protein